MVQDKAFIFDFDGTIAETIPLAIEAFRHAYADLNLPLPSEARIKAHFGPIESGLLHKLNPENSAALFALYLKNFSKIIDQKKAQAFPHIKETLVALKSAGRRLAVVTGKSRESADISIEKYSLQGLFEYVECGGETGSVKPQKIRKVLSCWDVSAQDVFYIGDSPQDIIDSRECGVIPVAAAWSRVTDAEALRALSPFKLFDDTGAFAAWAKQFA